MSKILRPSIEDSAGQPATRPTSAPGRGGWIWFMATAAATLVGSLIPLLFNHRFYFYDDTASGAFGIWYEIGTKLRQGVWPLFSDSGWAAGNYAAEGQWGIWNPAVMLLGFLASFATNPVVFTTIFKIIILVILATGVFMAARAHGATSPWAAIAGVAVPLAGFTVYMDAASWVTGLMVFSLIPWVWWGLYRTVINGKNPIPGLIPAYLLITVGYVHGTIMLALLIVAVSIQCIVGRAWRQLIRLAAFAVITGLVAVTVYLPGVLTAPVTIRSSGIFNSGFLGIDLSGLASSAMGSSLPQITGWWGEYSPVPMLYIAWFLPLAGLVSLESVRRSGWRIIGIAAFGIFALALTLAPTDLGPLRFPVRLTPYLVLAVILLLAVLLSTSMTPTITRGRVIWVYALWAVGAYLALAQNPVIYRAHVIFAILSAIGLAAVLFALAKPRWAVVRRFGAAGTAGIIIVVSLLTAGLQHHYFTAAPLPDFHMADDVAKYQSPLEGTPGIAFVSGNPIPLGKAVWNETLLSNQWYLGHQQVQNLYSPILFAAYTHDLCMDSHGWSCDHAVDTLFTEDKTTGKLLVDLLSIDTVQILKPSSPEPTTVLSSRHVPAGWTEVHRSDLSVIWVRDKPLNNTGAPVWTSPGIDAQVSSNSNQELDLKVTSAAAGKIVVSRLAWPGYTVSGATISAATRDYLITLDVPANAKGDVVRLTFEPPAWKLLVGVIYTAIALGALWGIWELYVKGRRRRLGTKPPAAE